MTYAKDINFEKVLTSSGLSELKARDIAGHVSQAVVKEEEKLRRREKRKKKKNVKEVKNVREVTDDSKEVE